MNISVIIRVKNEGLIFREVLKQLREQTLQSFEVIIVDDDSSDGTDTLASAFFSPERYKIVKVSKGAFSHPYSCNLGASHAQGDLLVYLNGHSIPISTTWLESGIKNFADKKIAGVFAYPLARPDANIFERIIYNAYTRLFHSKRTRYTSPRMGILGTTNAIIRKDLWGKYHFNELYKRGGEDREWAIHWMKQGYVIVQDPAFRTFHSHDLSCIGLVRQYFRWWRMHTPSSETEE